jgi:hypothetical protein
MIISVQFSGAAFYLSVLVQNMFLNTLFSTTLCLFMPWYERPNVTPVQNSGQNYNFVFFNLYVLDRRREILDQTAVCIPLFHNLNPRLWKKIYNYKPWRGNRVLELLGMILVFSWKHIGYFMTECNWVMKVTGQIILAVWILRSCLRNNLSVENFCSIKQRCNYTVTHCHKMSFRMRHKLISHKCKENAGVTFKLFGEAIRNW